MGIWLCRPPVNVVAPDALHEVSIGTNLLFSTIKNQLIWYSNLLRKMNQAITSLPFVPHWLKMDKPAVCENLSTCVPLQGFDRAK
jgi:hypothetical protein